MAQAAPVTFFGEDTHSGAVTTVHPMADAARASFFANLNGVGTETFEGFAANTTLPLSIMFAGAGMATLTGTGYIQQGVSSSDQFPISGSKFLDTDGTFVASFGSSIAAFGFYGTDLGDVNATRVLSLTDIDNVVSTLTVPDVLGTAANGSALYYGFYDTSDTYKSVSFVGAGNDIFGFDDFSIGSLTQVVPITVPEPSSLVLLTVSLLGLGLVVRRTCFRI